MAQLVLPITSGKMQNTAHEWADRIVQGNCLAVLPQLPSDSVDLIVTSPPYADNRKSTYGGVEADQCVEWFLPISAELLRVLKARLY